MSEVRLIDANALKPKIDKFIGYLDEDMIERIKVVIDNAPTIKPYCYYCGQTEHGKIEERQQGDLISREALKDEFEELCKTHCGLKKKDLCSITCPVLAFKETLANAPTVEQKYYERIVAQINPVIEARTQGKWIYGEDDCGQDGWFCSKCKFFVPWYYQYYEKDVDFIRDYKACPHCKAEMITYTGKDRDKKGGADMRGEEE